MVNVNIQDFVAINSEISYLTVKVVPKLGPSKISLDDLSHTHMVEEILSKHKIQFSLK